MAAIAGCKRLLIADASSLIHRGNALKGKDPTYPMGWSFLCRKLLYQMKQLQPSHVCVAGDGYQSSATRREIYPQYKANRAELTDERLLDQLSNVGEILNTLNIAYLQQEKYEADDIIHTVVHQAVQQEFDAIDIIADDKDLFALLQFPQVHIHRLSAKAGINPLHIADAKTQRIPIAHISVLPSQLPDFLALVGDAVDNIKGCPAIGVKRATWLLSQYGNLDAIFAHLDEIESSKKFIAKSLRSNEHSIKRDLSLVTLHDLSSLLGHCLNDMLFDIHTLNNVNLEDVKAKLIEFGLESVYDEIKTNFLSINTTNNDTTDNKR